MTIINPKNYDFLWLIHNWTYFDTSFWLVENYLKRDFIITCHNNQWKTYVSKQERRKLSKFGLLFFKEYFAGYKKEVLEIKKKARKFFKEVSSRKLSTMSDMELKKDFLFTMESARIIWRPYWFTQYFLYDGIEKKINANPTKNKDLAKRVKEMQKIKFELRKFVSKTMFQRENYIFKEYFKEIKKRTGRKDLYHLHYKEISDILGGKAIKKVNRKSYLWGKFNNWKPLFGNEAIKIINKFDKALLEVEKNTIKGQIANRGYWKGRVRIINFDLQGNIAEEAAKLKKGEVLVTGSTIPQMIIACRKAGAIVTEEGGIASHAAIVSREFGKPCIIATKIATQVLKDGDLVEVDADKGVVRKIQKRN